MKKKPRSPFPLRMDDAIRADVERAAKDDRRSINSWMQIAAVEKIQRTKEEGAA